MLFVWYPKCTTCQKAKRWLEKNAVSFEERHIKEENPTIGELREWHGLSGVPLKRFFNTNGLRYKELQLKDRLASMSEEEQYALLASDGLLVKRPILVSREFALVGFKEDEWEKAFAGSRG